MIIFMFSGSACARRAYALLLLLSAALFMASAEAGTPKRVLILHSFSRDFAPYDSIVATFRTELALRSSEPITFIEANLDLRRAGNASEHPAFLEYLRARFDDAPPDLVVTVGPVAARFYVANRSSLFDNAQVIFAALDERIARQLDTRTQDSVVCGRLELPKLVDNILTLLPDTKTIGVVIGASELEQYWLEEFKREFAPFADRVRFEWFDGLSLAQLRERVAVLPPQSAVLYAIFIVDAAGVPHERQDALASLRAVSNAPIFGIYENELGQGVVGGPYTSQRAVGENIARSALEALGGKRNAQSAFLVSPFESPVYDWRELKRWNVDESRLPPGSTVRFRPPTLWEEHRTAVVLTGGALVIQTALIIALVVQRSRRRRAEHEAEGLAGRLVTAHEDERRRLARELHDDINQRLAGLAIEAAQLPGGGAGGAGTTPARAIRTGLTQLSEDVHALSYRLHPTVIEDLGLEDALKIECDRVAQQQSLRISLDCRDVPRRLSTAVGLCLFRITQEALRNVARHADASDVKVSIVAKDGGLELTVRDNGKGFDVAGPRTRASLGIESMRERTRLLGGRFAIESTRGGGTSLSAWVPLKECQ